MSRGVHQWLKQACVRQPRISGGFAMLLLEFNEWLWKYEQERCAPEQFRAMLAAEGFGVIEVHGTLLVPGLGLEEDWEACKPLMG
jgi:hypothetical protein